MSKVHILSDSSIDWLKQQAKALKKASSITLSQALYEIAVKNGFANWKDLIDTAKHESSSSGHGSITFRLNSKSPLFKEYEELSNSGANALELLNGAYSSLVLEKFTYRQKFGAIARRFNLNPFSIKNSIHVYFSMEKENIDLNRSFWEENGFLYDEYFSLWLEKNDPFFYDIDHGHGFFRLITIDTVSYQEVEDHIAGISQKIEPYMSIHANHVWINGKIDPNSLIPDDDYPDPIPISELPVEVWARGSYQ